MSTGLCLVTRGMICVPRDVEISPLISCDAPQVQSVLEVRPKVRSIIQPPQPAITSPVATSSQELRPEPRKAEAPAPPSPDPRPVVTVTLELKPDPKKAEEE